MSTTPPPTPIQIHIPLSLQKYAIPLDTFRSTRPKLYGAFGTGAFIFHNNKLLLVQRAATEAFANLWEVPGGGAEIGDPTILHSCARETFEETGLRLTKFVRQIGEGQEFEVRNGGVCLKLNFEIEVEEIHGHGVHDHGVHRDSKVKEGKHGVEVILDPDEHQAYKWVGEDDIRGDSYSIVSTDQKALMLKAFSLRKTESERLKALVDGAREET